MEVETHEMKTHLSRSHRTTGVLLTDSPLYLHLDGAISPVRAQVCQAALFSVPVGLGAVYFFRLIFSLLSVVLWCTVVTNPWMDVRQPNYIDLETRRNLIKTRTPVCKPDSYRLPDESCDTDHALKNSPLSFCPITMKFGVFSITVLFLQSKFNFLHMLVKGNGINLKLKSPVCHTSVRF